MSVGFHVSKTQGGKSRPMSVAIKDIDAVVERGMRPCAQIFVTGPQSNKETLSPDDKRALAELTRAGSLRLVVHGAYIDNPWGTISEYSIGNICAEMEIAATIGATGVVVHLSNATGTGLDAVMERLSQRLAARPQVILWLEIHATKATAKSFETPAKLGALFSRVAALRARMPLPVIGLCIDSAHLHACGVDLTEYAQTSQWLADMTAAVRADDPAVPLMAHLNDSASELGSGIDKHAALCAGRIWGAFAARPVEQSGLMAILEWAEAGSFDTILERHGDVTGDLDLISRLGYFAI